MYASANEAGRALGCRYVTELACPRARSTSILVLGLIARGVAPFTRGEHGTVRRDQGDAAARARGDDVGALVEAGRERIGEGVGVVELVDVVSALNGEHRLLRVALDLSVLRLAP